MEYEARSTDTKTFSVTTSGKEIGVLKYDNWFSFKSEIILDDKIYKALPKGFWGTTIEIKRDDTVLLNFKMNWNGDIIIRTNFNEMDHGYVFKHKGIFKSSFVLKDTGDEELLIIQPDFKWKKFSYDYAISTNNNFDELKNNDLLLLATVHCANYYMTMMSSSGYA